MFVKAELFEKIGYFDERYGRGFGEENDFSERAKDIGYKIRLCDDVFIAHTGKASFGSEGPLLEQENMKVLLERFPEFLKDVTRFCETNPLAEVRANVNRHIKGMLPDSDIPIEASSELSRAVGRSIFSRWLIKLKDRKHFRAILRYGLNEFLKESSLSEELRVEGRGLYIAANSDPYLILPETSISSAVVNALRLRIKCETSRPAFAQLYWIHEQTEPFSEAKSVQLPLTHDDSWQEVLLDIRTSSNLSGWIAGPTIVRFRLDPIDRKGTFELREFSLGQLR